MAANEWYKHWFNTPFYHKLYFSRDEQEAAAFIRNLLLYLKPSPESRMLDVACGKGRHSLLLAGAGFYVIGIDLAPDSIAAASLHANEKLQFYVHDMRLPFWINYFDYAFNFFTSFGYFATRREHDAAMRTIAASLKPGGTVVFDYLNVHYAAERLVHNEIKEIGETVYDIQRWQDASHFYKKITIHDPSLTLPVVFTEKVAKFSLDDFTGMLSFQKLQMKEVFGNYGLGAYDVRKTPRMIIVAERS